MVRSRELKASWHSTFRIDGGLNLHPGRSRALGLGCEDPGKKRSKCDTDGREIGRLNVRMLACEAPIVGAGFTH
jgi:hypothetical protein